MFDWLINPIKKIFTRTFNAMDYFASLEGDGADEKKYDTERTGGMFSTHAGDSILLHKVRKAAATAWGGLLDAVIRSHSMIKLGMPKIGGAMDSGEDFTGSGGLGVKLAASLSQPNISELLLMWYSLQTFIGHQMCTILAQHWLIDKCCRVPARDAIRRGYDIVSTDGEEIAPDMLRAMKLMDREFKLNQHMQDFIHKGRIFGIRIVLFKIDSKDPDFYENPFNIDGVTPNSYKGMVQIDPYWTAPILDQESAADPASMHFYEPTWWLINGKRYHRSHLIIFRHAEVPDFLKPSYIYGGVPVPQQIMERVYGAERTANEGPMLAMTKRTTFYKTNLKAAYADKDNFDERMQEWIMMRDNIQVKIGDTNDDMTQQDTALGDLDSVIMTQFQLVAAAADIPATKLLQTQPKGFNSTGDYEAENYGEFLESIQANDLCPLARRHHQLSMKSRIGPQFKVEINTDVVFNPVRSPGPVDLADINLKKAQTNQINSELGAIDSTEIRNNLIDDPQSGYAGLQSALPKPTGESMEDEDATA